MFDRQTTRTIKPTEMILKLIWFHHFHEGIIENRSENKWSLS